MSPSAQSRRFEPSYAAELLRVAQGDFQTAEYLMPGLAEGQVRAENYFYFIQQVLEKCLKAVLVQQERPVPLVHDLGVLLAKIPEAVEPPFGYEISKLNEFAAVRRYEEGRLLWSTEEADEALLLAKTALGWARSLISSI